MELSYEKIKKFMADYFKDYNAYAQNPKTVSRMRNYFAPDLEFIPYVAKLEHIRSTSCEQFLRVLSEHPAGYEVFTIEDLVIDERQKTVVALIKAEIFESKTDKFLLTKRYLVHYQLVLDENKTIKIKKIRFFWEVLPAGALDVNDVFDRK